MSHYRVSEMVTDWECGQCGRPLKMGHVTVSYMKTRFTAEMLKCLGCHMVYVSEVLSMGKMKEAETALEDK
jgi:hypothetical protein